MGKTPIKPGWLKKTGKEREQCLKTVRACGSKLMHWSEVAAMLGVSKTTLWHWRKSDPKIDTMYAFGKSDLAERVAERLTEKALAGGVVRDKDGNVIGGEEGNTQALIHLSKKVMDLGDKQTSVNIDAKDVAESKGGDERFGEVLDMLGLGQLMPDRGDSEPEADGKEGADGD